MNRLADVVTYNCRANPGSMRGSNRIEFRRHRTWKAVAPNKITQRAKYADGPIPLNSLLQMPCSPLLRDYKINPIGARGASWFTKSLERMSWVILTTNIEDSPRQPLTIFGRWPRMRP